MRRFDVPIRLSFSGDHFAFHTSCVSTYRPGIYAASCPESTSAAEAAGSSLYTTSTNTGNTAEAGTYAPGTTTAICAAQTTAAAGDAETNGNYDTGIP
jgi:hypothetical protein